MSNRIILSMISGNEGKIIERLIKSVIGTVDAINVSFNGSDDTPEVVRKNAGTLPVNIAQFPWVNFKTNRNHSITSAKEFCLKLGWKPKKTFILLLDADMILVNLKLKASQLQPGLMYQLWQKFSSSEQTYTRLICCHDEYEYKFRTHELLVSKKNLPISIIDKDTLYIDDRDDGQCKSDKFVRDARLLKLDHEDNPSEPRSVYYLCQTYKSLFHIDEKNREEHGKEFVKWATMRIEMGGYVEEQYMAYKMLGQYYANIKDYEKATKYFEEGYRKFPMRAEILCDYVDMLLDLKKHQQAYDLIKTPPKYPPAGHIFGIHRHDYLNRPKMLRAKAASWLGKNEEAQLILELAERDGYQGWEINQYKGFFVKPIFTSPTMLPSSFVKEGYVASSPSLMKLGSDIFVNVRHVNYTALEYHLYSGNAVSTRNVLYKIKSEGDSLKFSNGIELVPTFNYEQKRGDIVGIEDLRLFNYQGEMYGLGTHFFDRADPRVGMFKIENDTISKFISLDTGSTGCEKNWLIFEEEAEKMTILYSHQPYTLYTVDRGGRLELSLKREMKSSLSNLRGSCNPIKLNDEWLGMTHEVVGVWDELNKKSMRRYYHRFIFYNKDKMPYKITYPFCFLVKGVEYTCGMILLNDNLLIGHSLYDNESFLSKIPLGKVLSMKTIAIF